MPSSKTHQQLILSFPVNTEESEGLSENLERVEKKSLVEFIREDLSEKLHLPEYYLYSLVLEYLESEDLVEVRKQFKQVLVLEKHSRGIEVMGVSEEQVNQFLSPKDPNLKLERSGLLLQRTRDRVRESLECESPLPFLEVQREVVTEMVQEEACLEVQPLSKEYFETPELVRRDLEGFAGFIKIGRQAKEKSVKYLSTGNPHWKTEIQLSNGEEKIWITYLDTVARVMGFFTESGNPDQKRALGYLLELVGVKEKVEVELNREYFENVEWVRQDLEGFAGFIKIGHRAKERSMKYLSTSNPDQGTKIKLSNGEEKGWKIYLDTVAQEMGFVNNKGTLLKKDALDYLLELVGVKEKVTVELNREYFENTEWVRQDLEEFAGFIEIGKYAKEKSVKYLSTRNPHWKTEIRLSNGEEKSWLIYLKTVARVMGFFTESGNPDQKRALGYLLELVGVKEKVEVELNREYFENVEWVKQDLEGFAGFIEDRKNREVEKVIGNLSTANPNQGTKIKLSNGEEKSWETYLNTVARVMGFFRESGKEDQKRALDYLLELMGVKEKVTMELNREYFENVEWVRQDLEGFVEFIEDRKSEKIEKVIRNLSTGNPDQGTKIKLLNGEEKSWQTYLKAVARVMGFFTESGEPHQKRALDYLLELVGVKEKVEVELNREYFENVEWVKKDLEGFAGFIEDRKSGKVEKVIENLSTSNPDQGTKIQLSNGDEKSWVTYLNTVARVMGFLNDKGKPIKKKALDYLKSLVLGNQEKDEGNENVQEKNLEALLTSTI